MLAGPGRAGWSHLPRGREGFAAEVEEGAGSRRFGCRLCPIVIVNCAWFEVKQCCCSRPCRTVESGKQPPWRAIDDVKVTKL